LKFELTLKAADEGEITTVTPGNVEETTGIFSSEDMKKYLHCSEKKNSTNSVHSFFICGFIIFFSLHI
jgi:hypothetical protein